jgi:hypothetical protein
MVNQIGNRERCKTPCGCCPAIYATPDTCTGSGKIGHEGEWGLIGFSPCGKYVAHQSDIPCNVTEAPKVRKRRFEPIHICQCSTTKCDCGSFLSHLISEPCTAVIHR